MSWSLAWFDWFYVCSLLTVVVTQWHEADGCYRKQCVPEIRSLVFRVYVCSLWRHSGMRRAAYRKERKIGSTH